MRGKDWIGKIILEVRSWKVTLVVNYWMLITSRPGLNVQLLASELEVELLNSYDQQRISSSDTVWGHAYLMSVDGLDALVVKAR